jgi:hypothetical protein
MRIVDGAQIILRISESRRTIEDSAKERLASLGLNTIKYENEKINEDLLRIQSHTGLMQKHGEFNELGKSIVNIFE